MPQVFDSLHLSVDLLQQLMTINSLNAPTGGALELEGTIARFSVGAPRSVLIDEVDRRGAGRRPATGLPLRVTLPVAFNCRPAVGGGDRGVSGVALVNAALLFEFPQHGGVVPKHLMNSYRIDCSSTTESDVQVFGAAGEIVSLPRLVAEFVRKKYGGTYQFPQANDMPILPATPIRVVASAGRWPQLILFQHSESGASQERDRTTRKDRPREVPFVERGSFWAGVINEASLEPEIGKMSHALNQHMNDGSKERALTDLKLRDGFVSRSAEYDRGNTASSASLAVAVPDIFTNSGDLPASLESLAADLLRGALGGISRASELPVRDPRIHEPMQPVARVVRSEVRRSGLVTRGLLLQQDDFPPITCEFVFQRKQSSRLTYVFDALGSSAPGSEIVRLRWELGDGTVIESFGNDVEFVIEHQFKGEGQYTVSLTVSDAIERVGEVTQLVSVGSLEVVVSPSVRSIDGFETCILVTSGNAPVPDASVHFQFPDGTLEVGTNQDGCALLSTRWAVFLRSDRNRVHFGTPSIGRIDCEFGQTQLEFFAVDRASAGQIQDSVDVCDQMLGHLSSVDRLSNEASIVAETVRQLRLALLKGAAPQELLRQTSELELMDLNIVRTWLESAEDLTLWMRGLVSDS